MAIETSPLLGGPANSRKHLIALAILGCTTIFAVAIITQVSVGPTELGAGEWDGWTGSGAEPEDNVFDTLDTTGDFTGWTGGEEEGNVFDSLNTVGSWTGWSAHEPEDNVFATLDTTGDFTGWTGGSEQENIFDSLDTTGSWNGWTGSGETPEHNVFDSENDIAAGPTGAP